jgi:predicted metal-dependent hydrolase
MNVIIVEGISINVIKSARRKTMAIKIHNHEASVHIPTKMPIKLANEFVHQKINWIKEKLSQQAHFQRPPLQFESGDALLYLGDEYTLSIIEAHSALRVYLDNNQLVCQGREPHLIAVKIRTALINWYKHQATDYLIHRTNGWVQKTGLINSGITVKTYKARWGSCSITGQIQYNWKLIMAPVSVIDYVIIHELCHTLHHNHSRQFWQLVEQICPRYQQERLWLNHHGASLDI